MYVHRYTVRIFQRKVVKQKSGFKVEIMKNIAKTKVVTTSEIAEKLGVSWNTAEKHLLELTIDSKIVRMKKAGVNLWVVK